MKLLLIVFTVCSATNNSDCMEVTLRHPSQTEIEAELTTGCPRAFDTVATWALAYSAMHFAYNVKSETIRCEIKGS